MALRNKIQLLIDALSVNNQVIKEYNFKGRNDSAWEFKK